MAPMKSLMTGLFLVALIAPVSANDGNFVRSMCMSEDAEQVALCVGYTTGLAQSLMLSNKVDSALGNFCASEFRPQDGGALMLEWLDAHPQMHDQDAAGTMLMALLDAYPCL